MAGQPRVDALAADLARGPATGLTAPAVELFDVTARVGGRDVFTHVGLTVRRGEFVALLGPNGAGKTTLLKVILGLVRHTAGTVKVLGIPTRRGDRRVGYLPQRHAYDAATRIRGIDIVRLGLDGHRWGTPIPLVSRLVRPARHRKAPSTSPTSSTWSARAATRGARSGSVRAASNSGCSSPKP